MRTIILLVLALIIFSCDDNSKDSEKSIKTVGMEDELSELIKEEIQDSIEFEYPEGTKRKEISKSAVIYKYFDPELPKNKRFNMLYTYISVRADGQKDLIFKVSYKYDESKNKLSGIISYLILTDRFIYDLGKEDNKGMEGIKRTYPNDDSLELAEYMKEEPVSEIEILEEKRRNIEMEIWRLRHKNNEQMNGKDYYIMGSFSFSDDNIENLYEFIDDIVNSKKVIVRYIGLTGTLDRKVEALEKRALKRMVNIYKEIVD